MAARARRGLSGRIRSRFEGAANRRSLRCCEAARRRADGLRRGLELMVEADFGVTALASRTSHNGDPAGALHLGIGYAWF